MGCYWLQSWGQRSPDVLQGWGPSASEPAVPAVPVATVGCQRYYCSRNIHIHAQTCCGAACHLLVLKVAGMSGLQGSSV
jgi:hypothetical protein